MADEFVEKPLLHEYDPAARRAYYLKTRLLKGQLPTAPPRVKKGRPNGVVKPPAKTREQRQTERRNKIEAQVDALKGRLEKLRAVLAEEVKRAQARNGTQSSKIPAKKDSTNKLPVKKLTAGQKAKEAKRAEEYRKKNPDQAMADELKSLTDKIKTIQERISKMRKNGSVGARRTTAK